MRVLHPRGTFVVTGEQAVQPLLADFQFGLQPGALAGGEMQGHPGFLLR
jgi:hypothetical protein